MLGCRWTVDEQTKQSSDMLREERGREEVEWGDRGILCVILQQKGVLSSKIPQLQGRAPKAV